MSGQRWGITQALAHIRLTIPDEDAAYSAIKKVLRRGEIEASAEAWGASERWRALIASKGELNPIPKELWEYAELVKNEEDTVSWPSITNFPQFGFSAVGQSVYGHGVHVSREDVERIWPTSLDATIKSEPKEKPISKGGAPVKHDWEGAFIEMARVAVMEDDTCRPALIRAVQNWFIATHGEEPSLSLIRQKVKRFHEHLWPPTT